VPSRPFLASIAVVTLQLALAAAAFGEGAARSADEELARIGREVPGFGGLFYDEQGRPNVYLLDLDGPGAAALKSLGPEVLLRRGDYELDRLLSWKAELRPLLALPGVVLLDVDEARNRLVIGLDATSRSKGLDRDRLERQLLSVSVPRQAVELVETSPFEPWVGVQSKLRPVPGGVQIVFSNFACTLGFNAYRGNVFGFVVNSHCTGVRGEIDGMRYSQSVPSSGQIGTEIADPGFSSDPPCPFARRCRFSDAAFARYDKPRTGVLGKIARPTFGETEQGSLTLNPAGARFTITGRVASPLAGDVVHKVGRTTGWTFGSVVRTCADINISNNDVTMFCQSVVRGGGGPGDSGSPVFYRTGGGIKVKLAGILWGGGFDSVFGAIFSFSPLENIEQELGPLRVN
jgi:hypothetical protein